MDYPGEKLVMKMWETVTEKGIGALLRPWQIRREGRAVIDVRGEELVRLAQAARDAEEIRAGRRQLVDGQLVLALPVVVEGSVEPRPSAAIAALEAKVTAGVLSDAIRKEVNVSKALLAAEAELENDAQEPPARKVEEDWLYRWREGASAVSGEELQNLWGRLLAGEVKSPGAFSLRTLEFTRNLSTTDALKIAKLCCFVIDNGWILRHDLLKREGVTLPFLLEMQELGVVAGVESLGMTVTLDSMEPTKFARGLISNKRVLVVNHDDQTKTFKLSVYLVTSLGREVLRLGEFDPHDDYLRTVGQLICAQGFEVHLASYAQVTEEMIRYFNPEKLCDKPQEGSA